MDALKTLILAKTKEEKYDDGLPRPELRKLWRQAAGLSQTQAAAVLSQHTGELVTRSRLANWELALNAPASNLLEAYRDLLETSREIHDEKTASAPATPSTPKPKSK